MNIPKVIVDKLLSAVANIAGNDLEMECTVWLEEDEDSFSIHVVQSSPDE